MNKSYGERVKMHYVGFCNFQPFMKKICTGFLLENPIFMTNSFTLNSNCFFFRKIKGLIMDKVCFDNQISSYALC